MSINNPIHDALNEMHPDSELDVYKDLKLEDIEQGVKEFFYGKEDTPIDFTKLILPGYSYKIEAPDKSLHTGRGGVMMFIDTARKSKIPDQKIASYISVFVEGKHINILDPALKINSTKP